MNRLFKRVNNRKSLVVILVAFTLAQVSLKVYFMQGAWSITTILFHIIWMSVLHLNIMYAIRSNHPKVSYLLVLYFQLVTPLILSFFIESLFISIVLSLPWLVILTSRFMLHIQRLYFNISLIILVLYSAISLFGFFKFINQPEVVTEALITEGLLFQEYIINLNTFAFAGTIFLIYLTTIKESIDAVEEDRWHSKWYVTLISHMSHHLRTPLTQVVTNFSLLKYVADIDKKEELNIRINEGTDEMTRVLNTFIAASNIKNLNNEGILISEVLKTFTNENIEHISLILNDKQSASIRGPEIVSLLLALNSFIQVHREDRNSFVVELKNNAILIYEKTEQSDSVLESELQSVKNNEALDGNTEFYFVFKLLLESGWKIDEYTANGKHGYKMSRIANNWDKRASS